MAEAAVRAGRLPKEAMQVFGPNGVLWSDFLGRPGSHDVVKEDTEADGKPDRNLRFDLDENVKIDPGERRFTESELFAAVLRVVPPSRPGPGEDPGTES